MATQNTQWTTYDGKTFGTQADADAHEAAVDTAITGWMATHMSDYVTEANRLAAGKVFLANMTTFMSAVRDA